MNSENLCGECSESGPICCDTFNVISNCSIDCGLRLKFSVQPFGASALDIEFFPQKKIPSDNTTMIDQGPNVFNLSKSSNYYTEQLSIWTVSCIVLIFGK